ncbi:MAG: hypothetical protein K6E50_15195 [Lachnospiraceae bacterium]|nr:hypothetical protein [Lachnospiraceae bacterium]
MGVSQMQGSPWHTEIFTKKPGDEKRHRSRCIYYSKDNSRCSFYVEKCRGSAHCEHYKECDKQSTKPPVAKNTNSPKPKNSTAVIKVGSRVDHISFGKGVVKALTNGVATIHFENGKKMDIGVEFTLKKGIMKLI